MGAGMGIPSTNAPLTNQPLLLDSPIETWLTPDGAFSQTSRAVGLGNSTALTNRHGRHDTTRPPFPTLFDTPHEMSHVFTDHKRLTLI